MTTPEETTALAAADQQFKLVNVTLDRAVQDARTLLAQHDATSACAILAMRISRELDLDSRHQKFAGEMLAAAAIRIANQ